MVLFISSILFLYFSQMKKFFSFTSWSFSSVLLKGVVFSTWSVLFKYFFSDIRVSLFVQLLALSCCNHILFPVISFYVIIIPHHADTIDVILHRKITRITFNQNHKIITIFNCWSENWMILKWSSTYLNWYQTNHCKPHIDIKI